MNSQTDALWRLWRAVPPWFDWLAMDKDGEWFAYTCEPYTNQYGQEWTSDGDALRIPDEYAPTTISEPWNKTKTQRP